MNFDIHEGYTIVTAKMDFTPKEDGHPAPLFLNGEGLELMSLTLNGEKLEDITVDDVGLTIQNPPHGAFTVEITTRIKPEDNTRLEGLYKSGGTYCTQCEAEGFRRITYYPDRPDVMTKFTVRMEAEKKHYPILLSNGNRLDHGDAEHGRHFAVWHDPHLKPCYLFALVAGDLTVIEDEFVTKSGRKVELFIYVRPGDEDQCAHAMESLKKSMKWDEDVYGLEYDLDIFNIVAVSDFNMGAMENKSLNIFNTALVLAEKETATDMDFMRVESVIAHEYFHNWSGNRVTCRDWFQLSLKEGLTVFRDQEFSADLNSAAVQRIDDVQQLRRLQFPEDAGPLAHPIRPDNYIEINNFYTTTVYEKGAEVIRMFRTLMGKEAYRKSTDLYFARYDGQAATCEEWIKCMEDGSEQDFTQFRLWYEQAGTPGVHFRGIWNADNATYVVEMEQKTPDTPGQTDKKPMHIPVVIGLLDKQGNDIKEETLHLTEEKQSFVIDGVSEEPVPSVLRGFSAPVKLKTELGNAELSFLMLNDNDGFNRWEAGQQLYLKMLNAMIDEGSKAVCPKLMGTIGTLIEQGLELETDKALLARALTLPSVAMIGQSRDIVDPDAIYKARQAMLAAIKREHRKTLDKLYKETTSTGDFAITPKAMGQRAMHNVVLGILSSTHGTGCAKRSLEHYMSADNMTERVAALSVIADINQPQREEAFDDFYARYKNYPLVVDKYFALQAAATRTDIIDNLKKLRQHSDFNIKNPNRVRSLCAAFAMNNPVAFHAVDGSGYNFLTDAVIELNTINPQIAARLLTPLREWRRYTPDRQEKMKAALERILETPKLSPDVFEIASKSLKG
jgi:aminopeptidase N